MAVYGQLDGIDTAERVFDKMCEKNPVSWTMLAGLYAMDDRHESALDVFYQMVDSGANVDLVAILSTVKACGRLNLIIEGRKVHEIARKFGLKFDLSVGNALVKMYFDCGSVGEARAVFDGMPGRDAISWTAVIGGYVQNGGFNEGLKLLRSMLSEGLKPDSVTIASVLPACARVAACKNGKEIHAYVIRNALELNLTINNALMDMYIKTGCMGSAFNIFEKMEKKDLVSWTVMIVGYSLHGQAEHGLKLFNERKLDFRAEPDEMLYVALLHACQTAQKVEEGWFYFNCLKEPKIGHFALMVGLLARAGLLKDAQSFMMEHEIERCPEVLRALLDGCRIHENLILGKKVVEELIEIEPLNAENYVMLANVYAANGKWEMVSSLKQMIIDMGLSTKKACSWIEVRNKVHVFGTGDASHPRSYRIYLELNHLRRRMEEEEGYIPGNDFSFHDVDEERECIPSGHSEMLAVTFGLISKPGMGTVYMTKNLRVCRNCHTAIKFLSKIVEREIVLKDPCRFHHFENGVCSCGDFW